MKRILEKDTKIVFDDIPFDIWYTIVQSLLSFHDLSNVKRVCHMFVDVVDRKICTLASESVITSMEARYFRQKETYWPPHLNDNMAQKWDVETDDTPFSRVVALFASNFINHATKLSFVLCGDKYMLITQKGGSCPGMSGKSFIIWSKRDEDSGNKCYCRNRKSHAFASLLQNIFKHHLVKGLGCERKIDLYTRLPTVELLLHLFNRLECHICYNNRLDGTGECLADFATPSSTITVPLYAIDPDSLTHQYI